MKTIVIIGLIASVILISGCTGSIDARKAELEDSGNVIDTIWSCSKTIQNGHLRGETEEETLSLACRDECGRQWQAEYYTYECKADKLRCFCEG